MSAVHAPVRSIPQPPRTEILAELQDVPWAMKLITDPIYETCINQSRLSTPTGTADLFVGLTLATPSTICAWQILRSKPPPSVGDGQVLSILKIGIGVNGHAGIAHGGFVSLLLDEILGTAADHARPETMSSMTAYLHVDYKKPVRTPTTLLCRAHIERMEGRKIWVQGSVEDGEGGIFARGDALFVLIPMEKGDAKL